MSSVNARVNGDAVNRTAATPARYDETGNGVPPRDPFVVPFGLERQVCEQSGGIGGL